MLALDKAIALEPKNIQYLQDKARLANWLKDEKLALKTYQQILILNPNDVIANKMLNLAKNPQPTQKVVVKSPLQNALDNANNAAATHQYNLAAQWMKKAIALNPGDVSLYIKLSQIYGTAKQPKLALEAIEKAIALDPTNIEYLRTRGVLGSWLKDPKIMADSYIRILKMRPTDEDALIKYASALLWLGKTDEAIKVYRRTLAIYPKNDKVWLQYAEVQSWNGDFLGSLKALKCYCRLKGEDFDYLKTKARIMALAGRYKTARLINEPLLYKNTTNPYLLITEVTALNNAYEKTKAVNTLKYLNTIAPMDNQVKGLNNIILTPLRSNINVEGVFTSASDTTNITNVPVTAEYVLSPATRLTFRGLYEKAGAKIGTGLETIDGEPSISDESAMVGFKHQFAGLFDLSASVGGLKIQTKNNYAIYKAEATTNLSQSAKITVQTLYDLYRPYLIPQSPRSISLEIREQRNSAYLEWQPFIQKYLNVLVTHGDLSNSNGYWHYNIWPKARVWASQHWLVTLGANADIWRYRKRTDAGYYAPLDFKGYEATAEFYYAHTDNVGLGFWGGFGLQKDETFKHYYYEEDLGVQLFLGIFKDWQLKPRAAYTLRKNPVGQYDSWSVGVVLTRRF